MHAPLGSRGALLGDLGVSLGAALGGSQRRSRIDMRGRGRWPSAGATLDLDFVNQQGYVYGQGIGRIRDLVTISGGAGGTVVGPDGLIVSASAPRFDYDPVSRACKGLLIEEQRTNNLAYSCNVNVGSWPGIADFPAPAAVNSLYSGGSSWRLTNGGGSGSRSINQVCGTLTAAEVAYVDVEKAPGDTALETGLMIYDNTASIGVARLLFTWATEAVALAAGSGTVQAIKLTSAGPNGGPVFRLIVASVAAVVGNVRRIFVYPTGSSVNTNSVIVHEVQSEVGSFATSYIPTTAAAVTRTADTAEIVGARFADFFNAVAGSASVDFSLYGAGTAPSMAVVSMDTGSSHGYLVYKGSSASLCSVYVGDQVLNAGALTALATMRVALAYDRAGASASLNAGAGVSGPPTPRVPVQMLIGRWFGGSIMSGHVKRLRYWPRRLSTGELQELTR